MAVTWYYYDPLLFVQIVLFTHMLSSNVLEVLPRKQQHCDPWEIFFPYCQSIYSGVTLIQVTSVVFTCDRESFNFISLCKIYVLQSSSESESWKNLFKIHNSRFRDRWIFIFFNLIEDVIFCTVSFTALSPEFMANTVF